MKIGDRVSDFSLLDQYGTVRKLSELLLAGPVVLFFYPAAMTFGCTRESCHFRDLKSEFEAVGAQRVGISHDEVEKQKQFSDTYGFDYPLLSDPDGAVASAFGVKRSIALLGTKRSTFVIDRDSLVIGVFSSEISFAAHADKALELLRSKSGVG